MTEHRLIEQVLEALGGYMQMLTVHGSASRADLGRFVDFFQHYADAFHHAKEEDILFETLCENGFSRTSGPVAAMLADHEVNRQYTQILAMAAGRGEATWSDAEIHDVVGAAGGYTRALDGHIQKEDGILYPMALKHLPREAQEQMARLFEARARDPQVIAEAERLTKLAAELSSQYFVR
jgi:hemerythrin-like domain-containing protein